MNKKTEIYLNEIAEQLWNNKASLFVGAGFSRNAISKSDIPIIPLWSGLGDLFFTKSLLKASNEALYDIVEYTKDRNIVVVVGAPWAIKNSLYNCAFVIYKGEILMAVPKKHLPNYNEFYEKRWFASSKNANKKDE